MFSRETGVLWSFLWLFSEHNEHFLRKTEFLQFLRKTEFLSSLDSLGKLWKKNRDDSMQFFPSISGKVDWKSHFLYFIVPAGIQIIISMVLFIITATHCNQVKREIHRMQCQSSNSEAATKKEKFAASKTMYVNVNQEWEILSWHIFPNLSYFYSGHRQFPHYFSIFFNTSQLHHEPQALHCDGNFMDVGNHLWTLS